MRYLLPILLLCSTCFAQMGLRDPGYVAKLKRATTSTFSPTDISGLKLWVKADQITGKTNGEMIAQWDDQSGNGNNLVQSVDSNKFYYVTNSINGLPTVTSRITNAAFLTCSITNTNTTLSIFGVFRIKVKFQNASLCSVVDSASNTDWNNNLNVSVMEYRPSPFSLGDYRTANMARIYTDPATNVVYMYGTIYTGTSNYCFLNSTTSTNVSKSNAFGYKTLALGTRYIGGLSYVNYSRFDYAEFLVYHAALSDADVDKIKTYLNGRWAVY
jgi:hypothetical protein